MKVKRCQDCKHGIFHDREKAASTSKVKFAGLLTQLFCVAACLIVAIQCIAKIEQVAHIVLR